MLRTTRVCALFAALVTLSASVRADILVPDSFNDRIMRFDSQTGALIDINFITNAQAGGVFLLPIEAQQIGNEIWVSDQNADSIFRFTMLGAPLGTKVGPGNNLDNIRGFGVIDNVLYVTNFGALNGAPGPSIRRFDATTGANLGSTFPPSVESPWDVREFDNSVFVSDGGAITPTNTGYIFRLDRTTGAYVSTFASGSSGSNGLSLPKGMNVLANGNLIVANNSTPQSVYEYNTAGVRVGSWPMMFEGGNLSVNGVAELGNGLIFVAAQGTGVVGTNGLFTLDRATGILTPIMLARDRPTGDGFIPNFANHVVIPEPAAGAALAILGLLRWRKR